MFQKMNAPKTHYGSCIVSLSNLQCYLRSLSALCNKKKTQQQNDKKNNKILAQL